MQQSAQHPVSVCLLEQSNYADCADRKAYTFLRVETADSLCGAEAMQTDTLTASLLPFLLHCQKNLHVLARSQISSEEICE